MKVLLDECVQTRVRHHLTGHEVFSITYLGWNGTKNGALLRKAAEHGFDVLLTVDQGMQYQQNPTALAISVICLVPKDATELSDLLELMPRVLTAIQTLQPKSFLRIEA